MGLRIKKDVFVSQGKHSGETKTAFYPQIVMQLTLTESCKFVLDALQSSYGGKMYLNSYPKKNGNWKPCWTWVLAEKTSCRALFQNLVNHSLIKREQMKLAIWCYDNVRGQIAAGVAEALKSEFKQLKANPQRLSERAIMAIKAVVDATVQPEEAQVVA